MTLGESTAALLEKMFQDWGLLDLEDLAVTDQQLVWLQDSRVNYNVDEESDKKLQLQSVETLSRRDC